MSRIRLYALFTAGMLMASAAWADDLGYVDCTSHPDSAQLFSKARQTPDSLGSVACGERFTILVYGFVFSRIQTKDGKVGYIYSNLITPDRGGAAPPAVPNAPAAVPVRPAVANAPVNTPAYSAAAKMDSPPVMASPAPEKPAPAGQLFPTPPVPGVTAPSGAAQVQTAPGVSQPGTAALSAAAAPQPAAASLTTATPSASRAPEPTARSAPAASVQPAASSPPQPSAPAPTPAPTDPQAAAAQSAQPAPAASVSSSEPQASSPAQPGPLFPNPPPPPAPSDAAPAAAPAAGPVSARASDSASPAASAEPAPAYASQPEAAQPAPDPVRSSSARSSWERPLPGVHQSFLVELYSGYTFDRVGSAGTYSNLSGGMGSFGYNLKPWLQIVGDTSYDYVSSGNVKNVLYGNHFGVRYFYHRMSRWNLAPFAEGLVGGSRFDVTVSGTGGYKTSDNCISYKAGGGVDIRINKHWEIRAIDVDYYRTSFGGTTQNNYWASAGVVLRLFGSGSSE